METFPPFPMEIIYMIFLQLLLADAPRIFHLKRKQNRVTAYHDIDFYGNLDITQPVVTGLNRHFRNWAKKYYVLVFAPTARAPNGYTIGGLWIRRGIDLVYIDKAFCASSLWMAAQVSFVNVTSIAVDATLLNDALGRPGYRSLMDEVLAYFRNVEHLVFMAPTRKNPHRNYYRGLRLVDEEEDEAQKQLAFANFYHCGAIVTNRSLSTVMVARSPEAKFGTTIRTRLHVNDRLLRTLMLGAPLNIIIFQRQGMRVPSKNTVTGPGRSQNNALSKIASRGRPVPMSGISAPELLDLVEESKTKSRPLKAHAADYTGLLQSQVRSMIW
ncbi:hypothetical protein N0V82_010260 [Gnomoniopsis sp. IMI 355080]|nr:hypothetical protein N0V82_010260 [Gnomoniopsis sp. IMI 355080]